MELTIALAISILSIVFTILNFATNRKDKSNKDTENTSYKWGQLDIKLENIEKTLGKIELKLDTYDKEIDQKIDEKISHHIREYHNK